MQASLRKTHPLLGVCSFIACTLLILSLAGCGKEPTFEAALKKGIQLKDKGNFEAAQDFLMFASSKNPESMEARYELAVVQLKLHDDVSAYAGLRAAEEKDRQSTVSVPLR